MANRSQFRITPRRVFVTGTAISVVLLVLHTVTKILRYQTGTFGIRWLSLGQEQAIGTWVASVLLALSAVVFLAIAVQTKPGDRQNQWHWFGLALIFVGLSVDEVAEFHEWLGEQEFLGNTSGILAYQWVVFGALAVLIAGIVYLPFVLSLDRRSQTLFVAAAIFFVGGAVVIEAFNGRLQDAAEIRNGGEPNQADELRYDLQTGVEEFCEFLGATLFLTAAVELAAARGAGVSLEFEQS